MNTIMVLGADGYIASALIQKLLNKKIKVIGFDNFSRRKCVEGDMNSISAIPIKSMEDKELEFKKMGDFGFMELDISIDYKTFNQFLIDYKPYCIVNLAHNPSAPYSMKSNKNSNKVLFNNIIGTNNILWGIKKYCPETNYVTIGSAGEYQHDANIDIEESYFTINYKGRQSKELIYPRRPNSIYHTSKVSATYLIDYLSRLWGLKCTNVQQGVVFGAYTDEINESNIYSRFDFDESFGTVVNRFIVQAVLGIPLTIYGEGNHQRSFLSLNDSIQALMIAIENPAKKGEVQSWNQLSEWHSINDLADMVVNVGKEIGLNVGKQYIETPRMERTDNHYYNFITNKLKSKGYKPTRTIREEVKYCLELLLPYKNKLEKYKDVVMPKINFKR